MKTKKKIFLTVMLTLVFAFSACGKKAENGNDVIIETKWSACDVNMVYGSGYSIMIPYAFNSEYTLDRGVSYYTFPFTPVKNVTITGAEFSEGYKYKVLTSQDKQMTFLLKVSA